MGAKPFFLRPPNRVLAARPSLYFDFLNNGAFDDRVTFSRGSTATYRDSTGTRQTAAINAARFDHTAAGVRRGLYLELASRTNHFKTSAAPATQTSASLSTGTYTLWMEGSGSIAVAGNTASITGAGTATAGNPVTFTVSVAGTVNYTVTGSPTLAQSEDGAFATSYIDVPSTTPVTRSADVISIGTLTPWFNSSEWTVVMTVTEEGLRADGTTSALGRFDDTTNNNLVSIRGGTVISGDDFFVTTGGVNQVDTNSIVVTAGARRKIAYRAKPNDFAFTENGAAVLTDSSGSVPVVTRFMPALNLWCGWVESLAVYPRAMSNGFLQAGTA
jgi:hypothetical protein